MTEKSLKEQLRDICIDDSIENISFNEKTFIIKFGDILNTYINPNNEEETYWLLDVYVECSYTFEPGYFKLMRGIINEYECSGMDYFGTDDFNTDHVRYSGFVHYNSNFCWGKSNVDRTANLIRDEGLSSELFNRFLIEFHRYLSISSHETKGRYKKLDLPLNEKTTFKLDKVINLNGELFPRKVEVKTTIKGFTKIDYNQPYEILCEIEDRKFIYNNQEIVPTIVRHKYLEDTKVFLKKEMIDVENLKQLIKEDAKNKLYNEIDNTPTITIQTVMDKLQHT